MSGMQLQDALQGFLRQLEADGRSPHTVGQYRRHVTALIAWLERANGRANLAALTPDRLARFFGDDAAKTSCRGGPKRAVSLNAMRTSIRCFFRWAHESGLAPANAARLLRRARCTPPPPRALRVDEQQRLLAALAASQGPEARRDEMLVRLLLGCGLRLGSALGLDVEDIDIEHGELNVRHAKNNRPCTVAIPKQVGQQLKQFLDGRVSGPLFATSGGRISTRHAQRRIANALSNAGITGRSARGPSTSRESSAFCSVDLDALSAVAAEGGTPSEIARSRICSPAPGRPLPGLPPVKWIERARPAR